MEKKTVAGIIAVILIASVVVFSGCVEEEATVSIPTLTPTPTSTSTPAPEESVIKPEPAPTSIITTSGRLTHNETWTDEVHITGDIHIPPGITLTIKPGTKIYVKANYDDQGLGGEHIIDEITNIDPSATPEYTQTHISFRIDGTLNAVGTSDNWITFTSDSPDPYNTDWNGMTFNRGSKGKLKYVVIEWTHTGPALHGTNDVSISHCRIRHTFWGGLHAFQCSPIFENNTIDDIGHEAFDTHKASPIIRYNNISHARVAVVFNYYDLNTNKPLIVSSSN